MLAVAITNHHNDDFSSYCLSALYTARTTNTITNQTMIEQSTLFANVSALSIASVASVAAVAPAAVLSLLLLLLPPPCSFSSNRKRGGTSRRQKLKWINIPIQHSKTCNKNRDSSKCPRNPKNYESMATISGQPCEIFMCQ